MPRYDDRYGNTRLYVGRLSSRTRSRDLERLFSRYGSCAHKLVWGCGGVLSFPPIWVLCAKPCFGAWFNVTIDDAICWSHCSKFVCDGRSTIHLQFLSNDSLTVSGNHLRRVRDVDMKRDFAFVEFSDPRDADDARYSLDGREFDGSRIIVEFSKGVPRGSREYLGRGPPPGSGRCFNCGLDGHWARDCKAGDWKNKCYRCGERGHIERQCKNSPKDLRRDRSLSRSPVRSRSRTPRRGRSRSRSYSRDRSYSRSRSPVRRGRSYDRDGGSRSPDPRDSPVPSKTRKRSRSATPDDVSPRERGSRSPSPRNGRLEDDGSPREKSRSPISPERDSPDDRRYGSPNGANGRSQSPSASPREDRSPVEDDDDNRRSPKGSESPEE